ncbi:hypothetical protein HYDPIDRAFT_23596 [Hydnomerulius pinastri MD-312]|nr:hypothetical protein HYDPIDRAFT_23596 [Hydnomerulius pinastri MD-312]
MDHSQGTSNVRDLAQKAVQVNKEHQHALKVYAERLEAELETVEKLLEAADVVDLDDEPELDVGGSVFIPGSIRAVSLLSAKELLSPDSPFYDDALRRSRYQSAIEVHIMKPKELEALAEAVRTENYRQHALDAQRRGRPGFSDVSDQSPNYLELNKEGLDWDRIAEKMSTVSMATRTARECEIRWLGDQHPDFNHELWSQEELTKLQSLVDKCKGSQPDWVDIAEKLGTNRTPLDCMRHGTTRKSHQWTAESDERLFKAIRMYGQNNWNLVARYVSEDATPSQCSNRYQKTIDPSLKRANWTAEEDARLRVAVAAYGSSWVDVAAVLPGRHNDQCRDRWLEQVNPAINKNKWTDEEDKALLNYLREHERASWKEIGERVGNGRTDNMCRSRYALLQRSLKPTIPTFAVNYQPSSDLTVQAAEASHAGVAPQDSSSSQPQSQSPAPPSRPQTSAPLRQEYYHRNEGSALLFLNPIVSSNPDLYKPHQHLADPSKPIMRAGASTNLTSDDFTASGSRAPKPKRPRKKKQPASEPSTSATASAADNNAEGAPPEKKQKATRPKPKPRPKVAGSSVLRFDSVMDNYAYNRAMTASVPAPTLPTNLPEFRFDSTNLYSLNPEPDEAQQS